MTSAAINQYRPMDTSARRNAPTPWRVNPAYSELAAIIDDDGYTVTICRPDHAKQIVEAVNALARAP
mgnify:CR=1 FL=1